MSHQEEGQYGCQCSSCKDERRHDEVFKYIYIYKIIYMKIYKNYIKNVISQKESFEYF